jgi:tetratricopeptide (TPR) repeat protein
LKAMGRLLRNCKLQVAESNGKPNIGVPPLARPAVTLDRCPSAFFILLLIICISQWYLASTCAQEPKKPAPAAAKERLFDRLPFDQIILKEGGRPIEAMTLQLPQRPLASIPTEGMLSVRLLDRPTEEFEVSWSSVARVLIFEQLLLEEAKRLTIAGNFDEAYDYYARLAAEYPSLAGLNDAIGDYLRQNALALYQAKQHDRALALLLTLHQRNPNYTGLAAAVETVASEIIASYLREGNYAAARSVLELWQTQFRGLGETSSAEWQRRFEAAATRELQTASRLMQEKNYVPARRAVSKATAIWPKLAAAASVVSQIEREFPFVTVGVLETSPREPRHRLDCWPALRTSRLTQRLLAEQVDFGAEGGIYRSPFGKLEPDETGRGLTLILDPAVSAAGPASALSPDSLARYLLATTRREHPWYRPDFGNLLSGISIEPNAVQLYFNRVSVRPEALLQIPPPVENPQFAIAEFNPDQVVFAAPQAAAGGAGLRAIVEQTFADDEAAVNAIVSGDIDVLDRVPPWQIERLHGVKGIKVEGYKLPTVHVLIPNTNRPLLAKREFRRALCFAIDRQWIVSSVLLGGTSQPGFEVISGPFPAGTSLSDPIRYAYNNRIAARPYEPRLATILSTVAWAAVNNPTGKKEDAPADLPEIPELTLAHPIDSVARIACQSIQMQLARVGIRVKLIEFSADQLLAGAVECDLRYAELAVWEPLTDACPLLGPGGLAGEVQSPFMQSALRQLDDASNWNEVRARLAEVHDIAHHELPMIPLWQTVNFFAYRESLPGIGQTPVLLYQNIEDWSPASAANVAHTESTP